MGINEKGHWNYNQMALQIEDIYDVLEVKFNKINNVDNDVNFLLMMDQLSGHGRCVKER